MSGYPQAAPEHWERRWRRADRDQGWSNPVGQDGTLVPAAQATSNFQLRAREQKRKDPALQVERRRKRKCTRCFEFRKLQISILQGIALLH